MKLNKILIVAIVALIVVSLSGCICCCGLDGATSKFKKSVREINYPEKITAGGKTFTKKYSNEYIGESPVRNRIYQSLNKYGFDLGDTDIDGLISLSGVTEAKSFNYQGPQGSEEIRGFSAKTDSPLKATASYEAGKQTASQISDIGDGGSTGIGDSSNRYTVGMPDGSTLYVVACKYSNMIVYSQSYDSYAAAEAGARAAIDAIDAAA